MNDTVHLPDPAPGHDSTHTPGVPVARDGVSATPEVSVAGVEVLVVTPEEEPVVPAVSGTCAVFNVTASTAVQVLSSPTQTPAHPDARVSAEGGVRTGGEISIPLKQYVLQKVRPLKETIATQIEQWATSLHMQLKSGVPSNQDVIKSLLAKIPSPLFVTAFFHFAQHFGHSTLEWWPPIELQTFIEQRYFREGYEEDVARILLYFGHKALVIQEFHKLFPNYRVSAGFVDHLLEVGCYEFVFAHLDRFGISDMDIWKKLFAKWAYVQVIEYCADPTSIDPDIVGRYLDTVRMVNVRSPKSWGKTRSSGSSSRSAEPEIHPAAMLLARNLQKLTNLSYQAACILIEGGFTLEVLQSLHRFLLSPEQQGLLITQCSAILGYLATMKKSPIASM